MQRSHSNIFSNAITSFNSEDKAEDFRRVVLQASYIDPTYMRNCLTFYLLKTQGLYAPRCHFSQLYINDDFQGLYVVIERIDKEYLKKQGLDKDGLVLKAESHDANWADKENYMLGFEQKYNDDVSSLPLKSLLKTLSSTEKTKEAFNEKIQPLLNLEHFMKWQMVHTLANNKDTFNKNYYLFSSEENNAGRFEIISWDADATWGLNWDGKKTESDTQRLYGMDQFSPRLLSIPHYKSNYIKTFKQLIRPQHKEHLLKQIKTWHEILEPYIQQDKEAWDRGYDITAEFTYLSQSIEERYEVMQKVLADEE